MTFVETFGRGHQIYREKLDLLYNYEAPALANLTLLVPTSGGMRDVDYQIPGECFYGT